MLPTFCKCAAYVVILGKVDKAEDSRHLLKPADVSVDDQELEPKVANKAEMEEFLDDLLV